MKKIDFSFPKKESIRTVMERDIQGQMTDYEFADGVWLAVCDLISEPQDLDKFPEPFSNYFATRLLEWEVGNGGFAQAAMNIPEWFEPAAVGYERLGKPHLTEFIRRASMLASKEQDRISVASKNLEDAFSYFREGVFDEFDNQLDEIGWWMDEFRIKYVRQNREAFLELEKID
jgi:hypothetical protein